MRVVQMSPFSNQKKSPSFNAPVPPVAVMQKRLFDIKSFKTDDWILLGLIVLLLLDGSEDYLLLCVLGYLFYMGL